MSAALTSWPSIGVFFTVAYLMPDLILTVTVLPSDETSGGPSARSGIAFSESAGS
jgi:hypothetical protein